MLRKDMRHLGKAEISVSTNVLVWEMIHFVSK